MPTIKQKAISTGIACRQIILRRTDWTPNYYGHLFFELGCRFIEQMKEIYGYDDLIEYFLKNPESKYWKWWTAEWLNHERLICDRLENTKTYLFPSASEHIEAMFEGMMTEDMVNKSFDNYTKSML